MTGITIRAKKNVSCRSVQKLFRRMEYSDWWSLKDIEWYLAHALFVTSAWHGRKLVGLGVLTGDGRIATQVDILLVDEAHQRQGIGTQLLEGLLAEVDRLRPYFCQAPKCPELGESLYRKHGFTDGGPTLLNHTPTSQRWVGTAEKERLARRKKDGRPEPKWHRASRESSRRASQQSGGGDAEDRAPHP